MRKLSKIFLTGLMTILPIVITLYILYALVTSLESGLGKLLPREIYRPGMGLLAGVILIFLIGLLLHAWVFRRLFVYGEKLMQRIPVVSSIYGAVRDLIGFFRKDGDKSMNQVVMVSLGNTSVRLIGFVTQNDLSAYPKGMGDRDTVAVFLPMSYQMGGFTVMMPRTSVQPIDMSFQDAMRFALTAGMSTGETPGDKNK